MRDSKARVLSGGAVAVGLDAGPFGGQLIGRCAAISNRVRDGRFAGPVASATVTVPSR